MDVRPVAAGKPRSFMVCRAKDFKWLDAVQNDLTMVGVRRRRFRALDGKQ